MPSWPEASNSKRPRLADSITNEDRVLARQRSKSIGGIIHTYQRYDPQRFPSPTQPPPDLVSPAFEHMLAYGSLRELTDEQLARAIHLDPSQIAGLGPSIDSLLAMLRERRRKILATYETDSVQNSARDSFFELAGQITPPAKLLERRISFLRAEYARDGERAREEAE